MLTDRRFTVLQLIGEGLANRKIAAQLNSSISTIAKETMHLYRKLSLADRDAAIALMRSAGGANAQTAGGSVSPEAAR